MKVIIISGGYPPSKDLLLKEINEDVFIICADSGANCLYEYNLLPNLLLGDFDSIREEVLDFFTERKCVIKKYPKDKDLTDTELAFNEALSLEPEEIVFLGCTGNRIDHTLGNLGLLYRCLKQEIKSYLKDDKNVLTIADKSLDIVGKKGDYFSLQAFGGVVKDLTIKNAKFPLDNYTLYFGDPLTVSNEFLERPVGITFSEGILLVIYSKD